METRPLKSDPPSAAEKHHAWGKDSLHCQKCGLHLTEVESICHSWQAVDRQEEWTAIRVASYLTPDYAERLSADINAAIADAYKKGHEDGYHDNRQA